MSEKLFTVKMNNFKQALGDNPDVIMRRFLVGGKKSAAIFFIEGLVNKEIMAKNIIEPLLDESAGRADSLESLEKKIISVSNVKKESDLATLIDNFFAGLVIVFFDGYQKALVIDIIQWEQRGISEPKTDVVVRGPREGFCETLRINMTLLRRKIHHPGLTFEIQKYGRYSNTEVAVVYIKGIVNRDVLRKLNKRLKRIDIDAILDSAYIEQLVRDHPISPFPTISSTEKPDIVAARLLEGRVGILVDGTPIALVVPMLFVEGFQVSEDYYDNFYYTSFMRIIRYTSFFVTVLLPGFFIAITSYHQNLIPDKLLITMIAAEKNTPFSIGLGVFIMGMTYELLREAGLRLPKPMGQAVSIVGAIVLGDAAVSAGLISASVLIIVAVTVVASFVNIPFFGTDTILRLIFLFAGWSMGSLGVLIVFIFVVIYLASMKSFGIPYLSPILPVDFSGLKDTVVRAPIWSMENRPKGLSKNRRRIAPWSKPFWQQDQEED
ncbi:MAG: spore germination protein [Bacillota bacterium]|jgi:spore germination protein KA